MGFVAWSVRNGELEEGFPMEAMAKAMMAMDKKTPGVSVEDLPPSVCLYRSPKKKDEVKVRVDGDEEDVVFDKNGIAWLPALSRVFFRFNDGSVRTMAISANSHVTVVRGLDQDLPFRPSIPNDLPPLQSHAMAWLMEGRTGLSSLQMCFTLAGVGEDENGSYPRDAADFRRCLGFLDAVPEARADLSKMSACGAAWAGLIAHWSEIEQVARLEDGYSQASKMINDVLEAFGSRRKPGLG